MTYDENLTKSVLINLIEIIDSGRDINDIQKDHTLKIAKRVVADFKVNGNLQPIPEEITLSEKEREILEIFCNNTSLYDAMDYRNYSIMDPNIISLRTLDFLTAGTVCEVIRWGDGEEGTRKIPKIPLKITNKGISWLNAQKDKDLKAETL